MTTKILRLPLLLALLAFPSAVFAHRLDEYLQATLVAIKPGEVQLQINLTPGVAVAEQVLGLIDRNRDGVISTNEASAYAELLARNLRVRLDQRDLELRLGKFYFPAPAELRTGLGFIQVEFCGKLDRLNNGSHRLAIDNRYLPNSSVYLLNAMQPKSGLVQITAQKRNQTQSAGEIEFIFSQRAHSSRALGIAASLAVMLVTLLAGVMSLLGKGLS